jgi:hypothetical protein
MGLLGLGQQGQTIDPGHPEVGDQHVHAVGELDQGLAAGGGAQHRIPGLLQGIADRLQHRGIIFREKHRRPWHARGCTTNRQSR